MPNKFAGFWPLKRAPAGNSCRPCSARPRTSSSNGALVLIFMLFLLLGGKADRRPSGVLAEIETSVKSYIVSTIFLSAATGMLLGATLAVLGVEFAWVFGLLAFLLNFVPSIGAIIASLLPLPVILLSPDMSVTAKVLAIVMPRP